MKLFALASLLLCLFAAPAFAIQAGQLPANRAGDEITSDAAPSGTVDNHDQTQGDGQEMPGAPVPEPGTMALAAMSAIALGFAARRRHNKQNN